MTIQEAKQIRIADYLQSLGYTPVKRQDSSLWYKSPLREEAEASFKVNTRNSIQWYDFGIGKGGNIIALASELYRSDNVPYLLECIAKQTPHLHTAIHVPFSFGRQSVSEPMYRHLQVSELSSPVLLSYLQERGISTELAKRECKELHFENKGRPYFAIGSRIWQVVMRCATAISKVVSLQRTSPISDKVENSRQPVIFSRASWITSRSFPSV